jgi:hypothetical protein
MEFKKIFLNFALLGLIVFGMMSFIIIFQFDNNSNERITDNQIINKTYNDLYANLSSSQTTAQQQNSIFGDVTPTESYGEVQIDSVVSPTKAFKSIILGIYNILIKLPSQILGVSPIVSAIISAILIMFLIIGIWAIWKGAISS